jgi:hypothetical protein
VRHNGLESAGIAITPCLRAGVVREIGYSLGRVQMSLGLTIKGPEGLVLAAESRVTLQIQRQGQPPVFNTFDNATKLFDLKGLNNFVGIVTYGVAAIGQRTAHSFAPELEASLKAKGYGEDTSKTNRHAVEKVAKDLSDFYMDQWKSAKMPVPLPGPGMTFIVSGFDEDEPYGRVYIIEIPDKPVPEMRSPDQEFGLTWGGQHEVVNRLMMGYDPGLPNLLQQLKIAPAAEAQFMQQLGALSLQVPFNVLALQDCVDLALFLLRTTIEAQQLSIGLRGCGGPIDVATVTRRAGLHYVQRKIVRGQDA